jgi:hypothetical protein
MELVSPWRRDKSKQDCTYTGENNNTEENGYASMLQKGFKQEASLSELLIAAG